MYEYCKQFTIFYLCIRTLELTLKKYLHVMDLVFLFTLYNIYTK